MINNTPESKLDKTIKETLTNYEASYDENDWSKMENLLEAAPKVSTFKWSTVVGLGATLAIICGGYFLYTFLNSSNKTDKSVSPPARENVVKAIPKTIITPPPVIPPNVNPTAVSEEVKKEIAEPEKISPAKAPEKNTVAEAKALAKEEKIKNKKEKSDAKKAKEETDFRNQKVIGMGNEPIFGDMLDSSKGIVGETREKEETKKAAKAKKDLPVGWDNFMLRNVNPDSLKRHREKKDTSKVK